MTKHSITVKMLRLLLQELQDDDVLVPNQVRNLSILRDDNQIGFVDLLEGRQCVELDDKARQ